MTAYTDSNVRQAEAVQQSRIHLRARAQSYGSLDKWARTVPSMAWIGKSSG